jgi:hypothetical protein
LEQGWQAGFRIRISPENLQQLTGYVYEIQASPFGALFVPLLFRIHPLGP